MRAANFVEETTTSIAGTGGNGAVTLTAVTGRPRFSTVFGTQATTIRYVIEDTTSGKFETGVGVVSANVLTRTRPQVTWDGTTYDDSTPSPLDFGASPSSGNIKIRISQTAETQSPVLPGSNQLISGDSNWRDYPVSNAIRWSSSGGGGDALTANREYYTAYFLNCHGLLQGVQFEVITASASSSLKISLHPINHEGIPGQKIVDFTAVGVATTGIKTDTGSGAWSPAGPIWLTPGYYAIGFISNGSPVLRGNSSDQLCMRTPFGRHGGYGHGNTIFVAGSYATGIPSLPNLAGGSMVSASNNLSVPWFGLKVIA